MHATAGSSLTLTLRCGDCYGYVVCFQRCAHACERVRACGCKRAKGNREATAVSMYGYGFIQVCMIVTMLMSLASGVGHR
jgi:hypothetical protein